MCVCMCEARGARRFDGKQGRCGGSQFQPSRPGAVPTCATADGQRGTGGLLLPLLREARSSGVSAGGASDMRACTQPHLKKARSASRNMAHT